MALDSIYLRFEDALLKDNNLVLNEKPFLKLTLKERDQFIEDLKYANNAYKGLISFLGKIQREWLVDQFLLQYIGRDILCDKKPVPKNISDKSIDDFFEGL